MKNMSKPKATRLTHLGNHLGWLVRLGGSKYRVFCLTRDDAVNMAMKKHSEAIR